MAALVENFKSGLLDSGISGVSTLITSSGLVNLQIVSSPDTMKIVLDPQGTAGDPEIVTITSHPSGSDTATITRGLGARGHLVDTRWIHAVTAEDFQRMGFEGDLEGDVTIANGGELFIDGLTVGLGQKVAYSPEFTDPGGVPSTTVDVQNGTLTGEYIRVGDLIIMDGKFTLGSLSTITGEVRVKTPIVADDSFSLAAGTTVTFWDTDTSSAYRGAGSPVDLDEVQLRHTFNTEGLLATCNATVPFTWAVGDVVSWQHVYRAL